jgi:hypothetical protein
MHANWRDRASTCSSTRGERTVPSFCRQRSACARSCEMELRLAIWRTVEMKRSASSCGAAVAGVAAAAAAVDAAAAAEPAACGWEEARCCISGLSSELASGEAQSTVSAHLNWCVRAELASAAAS